VDGVSVDPVSHARVVSCGIVLGRVSEMLPAAPVHAEFQGKCQCSYRVFIRAKIWGEKENGLKYKYVFCRNVRKNIQIFFLALKNVL
jgi:hypothetical protein